jgi:hypothetical protein
VNVQCDIKARKKQLHSSFGGVSRAARMSPTKFPTGIAEQATLGREIRVGFWSLQKVVA